MTVRPSATQFRKSEGVESLRVLGEVVFAFYRTGTLAAHARLVQAMGDLPGVDHHAPDVDVERGGVTVRLRTIAATYRGHGSMMRNWPVRCRWPPVGWASSPTH